MKITVIGSGRWGSFIAWYLNRIGQDVSVYGRKESKEFTHLQETRSNDYIIYPDSIVLTTNINACFESEVIVISIPSQNLYDLMQDLKGLNLENKTFVLCMKGIDTKRHKRLSEIVA